MDFTLEIQSKVLDSLSDSVFVVDSERKITYWNNESEKLTGFAKEDVVSKLICDDLFINFDKDYLKYYYSKVVSEKKVFDNNVLIKHKNGKNISVSMRVIPIEDEKGNINKIAHILKDNSEMVRANRRIDELQKIALLDSLTGLGNRRFAEINLQSKIAEFHRYDWPFGMLFIDIDDFKSINDNYGHDKGDFVLKTIGDLLSKNLRMLDIVTRWGGEEFVVILVNIDEYNLKKIAEKIRIIIEKYKFNFLKNKDNVTISVGATLAKKTDTADILVKRSDELLYKSKNNGKNCVSTDFEIQDDINKEEKILEKINRILQRKSIKSLDTKESRV